jgi:hypothetical protein
VKNIILLVLPVYLLAFSSCKKSSSAPPSIVGTWTFTNLSGTDTFNYTSQTLKGLTTYSYNSATGTLTASTLDSGSNAPITRSIKVISEIWTFNADSTYTISETYGNPSQVAVDTGTWYYISNAYTNNEFALTGAGPNVLQYIVPVITNGEIYKFNVAGNTMILTDTLSLYYDTGYISTAHITITFTKQ